jgi:hypothetical protein
MCWQLQFWIADLPASGSLNQLSQVFSLYGYEPKAGVKVTSQNTVVTGSNNRILYVRPVPDLATINKVSFVSHIV